MISTDDLAEDAMRLFSYNRSAVVATEVTYDAVGVGQELGPLAEELAKLISLERAKQDPKAFIVGAEKSTEDKRMTADVDIADHGIAEIHQAHQG